MKTYADNKRARFNYQIIEEIEAGIVLSGPEVKSIRAGQISIKEAFITAKSGELFLTNAHITKYKPAHEIDYDPTKSRKILLKKSETQKLIVKSLEKGNTLLPLKIYDKNRNIKVLVGLGKGKKRYDKRETIKKREQKIEIKRALKNS